MRQIIRGGYKNDEIFTGDLSSVVFGGAGHDTIVTGLGRDTVYGGGGNDTIFAGYTHVWSDNGYGYYEPLSGTEAKTVFGGAGHDSIYGSDNDDRLNGGSGDDFISGNAGDDVLLGGSGNDFLIGGSGSDWFNGGDGVNTLMISAGDSGKLGWADELILQLDDRVGTGNFSGFGEGNFVDFSNIGFSTEVGCDLYYYGIDRSDVRVENGHTIIDVAKTGAHMDFTGLYGSNAELDLALANGHASLGYTYEGGGKG